MGKQLSKVGKKTQVVPFLQDGQYYYKRGLKAYREQNFNKAMKHFERAAELDPKDTSKLIQLATIYTEMGNYQQSNELLDNIINKLDPTLTECHYFMANNFAHLGLFHEAYKCATAYTDKDPYGEFMEENEDLIELLTLEEDLPFSDDPDDLIVKQDRAKSMLENNEFEEAIELLEKIIKDYPEFWSAYNNLSLAYFYIGDINKAKEILEDILQKKPGNLHALCNLLVFYFYERKDDKVDELAGMLSNIHPILFEHRYKLGATFALVRKYAFAYRWLRSIYKQGFEGDETFYYWLSYSSYYVGNVKFAEQMWERVLQENPSKKGTEPWNEDLNETHHFLSMTKEERLYAIFLAAETENFDQIEACQNANVPQSNFEKDFIQYILQTKTGVPVHVSDSVQTVFQVIKMLYTCMEDEAFFLYAFRVLMRAHQNKLPIKNGKAWACALEYVWKKENDQSLKKSAFAKRYEISVTTVVKYIQYVKAATK
ncbi:tetratricopeptide repeat protein [Metabacillus fastidiosus]|uniref:tetratricopeptide repeat protein n=1 Tax=Metabacillus fastidiosus TaxID=1458 RepID=UPI003D2B9D6E